ncbi:MAG: putative sporulation protein YtxC [Clostridia bacterium]|nr:putative sporulation protein YtxC [Clostridia bacterium]
MQTITISIDKNAEILQEIIQNNISDTIKVKQKNDHELHFTADDSAILNLKIAEILTEYIIRYEEKNILKMLLMHDYLLLHKTEKLNILTAACKLINENESDFIKTLILLKRRFLIKQNILEYLNENTRLDVTGFVAFRLSGYKKMLSELIQKVVEDFKIQQEYKEFINMLKFFVETQKNRSNKIHIIFEKNGEYTLFDENNKDITEKCFSEFSETKEQNNLNNEDVLISSLITLAPKKVFLHFETENFNKKIVHTIEQIFENKVFVSSVPLLELVR